MGDGTSSSKDGDIEEVMSDSSESEDLLFRRVITYDLDLAMYAIARALDYMILPRLTTRAPGILTNIERSETVSYTRFNDINSIDRLDSSDESPDNTMSKLERDGEEIEEGDR